MNKTRIIAGAIAFFGLAASAQAATMHLTPADVQTNPAAIQQAMNQLQPGETLYLAGGSYTPSGAIPSYIGNTLDIRPSDTLNPRGRSGRADAWITVRNEPGQKPVLNLGKNGAGGLAIVDALYWRVEGLELVAASDASSYATGISTVSTSNGTAHHIQFVNNIVHGFGASGFGVNNVSQVLIEGNTVYDNAHRSSNGASGISLGGLSMKSTDNSNFAGTLGNPNNDYAMIVRNNKVYYNRNLYPDTDHGSNDLTDGNGIIIDYCDETGFTGKTLVSNNVVYNNGGAGVHVFKSSNTDVFHNTLYQNGWLSNGTQLSSVGPLNGSGVTRINRFFNNIAVGGNPNIQNGTYINGGKTSGGNKGWQDGSGYALVPQWDKNLFFNTSSTSFPSGSISGDPKFVKAQLDTTSAPAADFHLSSGSPAINAGAASSTTNVTTDHESKTRDSSPDIGAYEAVATATPTPTPTPTTGSYKVRFYPRRGWGSRM
ncbi:MAG TPA: right-handed parallel beta-helix repeat-containing protein, partial [Fibrella sp.]